MITVSNNFVDEKISPFKFLDAYQKSDVEVFYGRTEETKKLIKALRKSSVVVLYGPSGSGKSSLINCGLLNRLKVGSEVIFEIRRTKDMITALAEKIFADQPEIAKKVIRVVNKIYDNKKKKEKTFKAIKANSQQMLELKSTFQSKKVDEKEMKIQKEKILGEKVKSLAIMQTLDSKIAKNEAFFVDCFNEFLNEQKTTPYLIFDQFEEIFTANEPDEIHKFGVFLSLVYNNNFSVKTLLSLREEYFSKLGQLETYLPKILYRKCLVDNPDKNTLKIIIQKSFKRFNINQLGEGKQLIEEKRISDIIKNLEDEESQIQKYHLPFLQIYLHKLYLEDFERTYPDGINERVLLSEHGYPFIEFTDDEIKNYGDIKKALNNYIVGIDLDLKKELKSTVFSRKKNLAILFLKEFSFIENVKKRVRIKSTEQVNETGDITTFYEIEEPRIIEKLKDNISQNLNKESINLILTSLIKHRLLKKTNDGYLELSHDILAKVINAFSIEKSMTEILGNIFQGHYEAYSKKSKPAYYLKRDTIEALKENNVIDFILEDLQHEKEEKTLFWKNSVEQAENEQYAELEGKNKQIKALRDRNILIGGTLFITLIALALFIAGHFRNEHSKGIIQQQKKEKELDHKVFKGTANAYESVKIDRTSAMKTITNSEEDYYSDLDELTEMISTFVSERFAPIVEWLEWGSHSVSSSKPDLIDGLKNDLIINLNKTPFYSQQIALKEKDKNPIIRTKYITYPTNPDSVAIFFLTNEEVLFHANTNYTMGIEEPLDYELVAEGIVAFEPYWESDAQLSILLVKNDRLYRKRGTEENWVTLKDDFVTIEDAKFLAKNKDRFVTNYKKNIVSFKILEDSLVSMETVIEDASEIESFQQLGEEDYLIVFEKDYYFVRSEGEVKWLDKTIKHNHEDGIASMDRIVVDKKYQWLLGSYDRTASLWKGGKVKKEKKRLIGHGDKILKTSFLDREKGDFVITSSADGTIKIWNLKDYNKEETKVKAARSIEQLKVDSVDSRLYVGFKFNKQIPDGYMVSYCDSLKTTCQEKHYQQIEEKNAKGEIKDNKGHITSFTFGGDNLLLTGGFDNKLVSSTVQPNLVNIRKTGSYPTIVALDTKDTTLAMATKDGLYYFRNYLKDPIKEKVAYTPLDTLKGQNFNSVAFHPTKPLILATAENSNIYLWNTENGEITTLSNHLDKVRDAEFSADGNWIISGSWDNTAILWHWETTESDSQYIKKEPFLAHTNDIEDVEFFGNDLFLTASSDHTVRIFENKDGKGFKAIPSLIRHDHKITAATFSADGKYIFSGDAKGVIKKWAFREFEDDIKERLGIKED